MDGCTTVITVKGLNRFFVINNLENTKHANVDTKNRHLRCFRNKN